jgi:hypothetical protein
MGGLLLVSLHVTIRHGNFTVNWGEGGREGGMTKRTEVEDSVS